LKLGGQFESAHLVREHSRRFGDGPHIRARRKTKINFGGATFLLFGVKSAQRVRDGPGTIHERCPKNRPTPQKCTSPSSSKGSV
jgi:hypothetical protein